MAKMNQNRNFGIDLEMFVSGGQSVVARALREEGLDAQVMGWGEHTNGPNTNWHVTTDGSLGSYSTGVEVVSPILKGDEGMEQIRKVTIALEKVNARVNKETGFHVHVEARGMLNDVKWAKTLVQMYSKYEHVIDAFMPASRKRNNAYYANTMVQNSHMKSWFKTLDESKDDRNARNFWRSHFTHGSNGKYHKVNFAPLWSQETVEFRQHSGTVEFNKISAWVKTVIALVENSDRNKERNIKPVNPKNKKVMNNITENSDYWTEMKAVLDADLKAFFRVIRPDRKTAKTLRERFAKNWNK